MTDRALTLHRAFSDYAVEYAKPNGVGLKRIVIAQKHAEEFFGVERDLVTQPLKRKDFRDYRARRLAAGVADSTIRRELGVFYQVCAHAVAEERLDYMPAFLIPPEGSPRERWFTEPEVLRILEQEMSPECRLFILIALFTGARLAAIIELTVERINFTLGTIDFRVPGARVTKKRRVETKLANELRPVLEAWCPKAKPMLVAPGKWERRVVGRTADQISAEIAKVFQAAGVKAPGVRCHCFRRTFTMWAFLNGATPIQVSAATGDTITTLQKSYVKLFPEHAAGAVNAIHLNTNQETPQCPTT